MKKIYIDAGHGGNDPGAVANGMRESEINLDVALSLEKILSSNFATWQSRRGNHNLTIKQRWQAANAWGADIFISIHANAFSQPTANGTEVFIFDNGSTRARDSRRLASLLVDEFSHRLGLRNRGVRLDGQSQHTGGLGVLRNTQMPAVLYELAFITAAPNFPDVQVLRTQRELMAAVLAEGIFQYFGVELAPPTPPAVALDILGNVQDITGYIENGATFVRLTEFADALGFSATWDEQRRIPVIRRKNT